MFGSDGLPDIFRSAAILQPSRLVILLAPERWGEVAIVG